MNLRGGGVKKCFLQKTIFQILYKFIIQYYMYTLYLPLIYNYIILLHARRTISATLYMYIHVPFVRANGNYYESFVTIPCPNLSYNESELFASDRQWPFLISLRFNSAKINGEITHNSDILDEWTETPLSLRCARRGVGDINLICDSTLNKIVSKNQLYRYFNFQSLIKRFH